MKNLSKLTKEEKNRPLHLYALVMAAVPFFLFIFMTSSFAQSEMRWKGSGGWGPDTRYSRMYNLNTLDTISGEVMSVEKITPEKGMAYGVHLMVRTHKEAISVHLGPGWYIENQDINIKTRDKIEVKGSRVSFEGKPAIIAAEITTENGTMQLRNKNGIPVWSGWRRSQDQSSR